jgi:hypothetical protein
VMALVSSFIHQTINTRLGSSLVDVQPVGWADSEALVFLRATFRVGRRAYYNHFL